MTSRNLSMIEVSATYDMTMYDLPSQHIATSSDNKQAHVSDHYLTKLWNWASPMLGFHRLNSVKHQVWLFLPIFWKNINPIMWLKQECTTHLEMVSIPKGMVLHCFTHIVSSIRPMFDGLMPKKTKLHRHLLPVSESRISSSENTMEMPPHGGDLQGRYLGTSSVHIQIVWFFMEEKSTCRECISSYWSIARLVKRGKTG